MSESICPNCGNVLTGERPKFCDQCGSKLTDMQETPEVSGVQIEPAEIPPDRPAESPAQESISDLSEQQKQLVYLEKLKEARSDGKVPVSELEELDSLREQLGISPSQAEELSNIAIESLRPVRKDDFDQKTQTGTSRGLALWINTNQFYMQGFRGVIDIKLENLSDETFESVKVELSSDLLDHSERWGCRLEACQNVRRRFSVKPSDAGIECVQLRISARQGNNIYAFWADTDLLVFEHTQDLRNISIQANKLIDFGSVSDEAKNMGNSVKSHIENFLKFDKIRTANDLMIEYRKLPTNFKILKLTFDPERSDQLTNSMTVSHVLDRGKRIIQPQRGSLTDAAGLQIRSKGRPVNLVLLAKPEVTLGKNRRNDIVTRICPRSPGNDRRSNQMGRDHCRLELTDKGAFVKDHDSVNGTLLDGKAVDAEGRPIKADSKELELGGVLNMSVGCLGQRYQLDSAAYEKVFAEPLGPLWESATKAGLHAITLKRLNNLGEEDPNGCESYCLLYRIATIGSRAHCSISFADKGLEPLHAAMLYLGRRFYLENLSDLTDVVVNKTTLSKNELMPLSFGDRIRIARVDMKFQQRSQLYVDAPDQL